jgi:GGDEF domain-containing protein
VALLLQCRRAGCRARPRREIANRIRANLAESLLIGGAPAFTASFGVADSSMSDRLEQLIRIADDALYTAKDAGRDRAVIGNPGNVVASVPRRAMEHPASVDIALVANNG